MEALCPSCGLKHETNDYPGAVEIPCSCGYSVFIDDSSSRNLSPETLDPAEPFLNSPPLSFESQDSGLTDRIPDSELHRNPLFSNSLTAPEDLPKEMPYDPYELGNKLISDLERDAAEDEADAKKRPRAQEKNPNAATHPVPKSDEFQKQLLNRIQTASIGRFIGNSFNVQLMNLDQGKDLELLDRIETFLSNHVWIREEIQKRKIDLRKMLGDRSFQDLPESLAVEIYLRSFELGALCKFEKSDYESSEL